MRRGVVVLSLLWGCPDSGGSATVTPRENHSSGGASGGGAGLPSGGSAAGGTETGGGGHGGTAHAIDAGGTGGVGGIGGYGMGGYGVGGVGGIPGQAGSAGMSSGGQGASPADGGAGATAGAGASTSAGASGQGAGGASECTDSNEPCDGPDDDACNEGVIVCNGGSTECSDTTGDNVEACDWIDNNCDGLVDESDAAWSAGAVTGSANAGGPSAIAVDASGETHLFFYDSNAGDLVYLSRSGVGAWSTPLALATDDNVGNPVAAAAGPDGSVHVAYRDATNKRLKYIARTPGGSWGTAITVGGSGNLGSSLALGVDPAGVVHIAYRNDTLTSLGYARLSPGGSWVAEAVDNDADVGDAPALAVDADGVVHVSYYETTGKNLRYATRTAGGAGAWSHEQLDATGNSGSHSSIAVDTFGGVHIAYFRSGSPYNDLRYAYRASGEPWTTGEAIPDDAINYGSYSAIATDARGRVHVAFRDTPSSDLRYSVRSGGAWAASSAMDSAGKVGEFISLSADADGHVVASYFDRTNQQLKVATRCLGNACPTQVRLELLPELTDIDIGWKGTGHDLLFPTGAAVTLDVSNCDNPRPPCGTCDITGPVLGDPRQKRCRGYLDEVCGADADCPFGSICEFYYGPPAPVFAGSTACVVTSVSGAIAGTMNMESGVTSLNTFDLRSVVSGGNGPDGLPCPVCEGDTTSNDGVQDGTCIEGPNDGGPCDVGGSTGTFGLTSLDCPSGSGGIVIVPLTLGLGPMTTAGVSREQDLRCDSGFGNYECLCGGESSYLDLQTAPDNCWDTGCIVGPDGEGICGGVSLGTCNGGPRNCADDGDCSFYIPGDTCTVEPLSCFGDTVTAIGSAAPFVGGSAQVRMGSIFCVDGYGGHAVDGAIGITGPGRIQATIDVTQIYE